MSNEPKLIFKVELMNEKPVDGAWPLKVTIGIANEALLALALRKMDICIYELLTENEMKKAAAAKSDIIVPHTEVPSSLMDKL